MISVLLPARDPDPRLFARALRSTLKSRGADFEVVVVDHGSTVPLAVPKGVTLLRVERDHSFPAALEIGRAACRAPLIARMDADDIMHPLRLAEDEAALGAGKLLAAVTSRVKVLPRRSSLMQGYVTWQNSVLSSADHQRDAWIEQPFCNPATTYRLAAIDAVGGWRANPWPEDYDLFLRFVARGMPIVKRPLIRHAWRQHFSQITRTVQATQTRNALAACKAHHLVPLYGLRDRPIVVVGAGKEGRRISRALRAEGAAVSSFCDVDPKKIGRTVQGAPVLGEVPPAGSSFAIAAVGTSGARGAVRALLAERGYVEGEDAVVVA